MQIVIDIDEKVFKELPEAELGSNVVADILDAVEDGTILPKGHGRLIDEPTEEEIAKTIGGKNDFADCIREAVKIVFANALTIIEADKEE